MTNFEPRPIGSPLRSSVQLTWLFQRGSLRASAIRSNACSGVQRMCRSTVNSMPAPLRPGGPRHQHVLEVLACTSARAAVDVPLVALLELEPGPGEQLRIEIASVVHDDDDPSARTKRSHARTEHTGDAVDV